MYRRKLYPRFLGPFVRVKIITTESNYFTEGQSRVIRNVSEDTVFFRSLGKDVKCIPLWFRFPGHVLTNRSDIDSDLTLVFLGSQKDGNSL